MERADLVRGKGRRGTDSVVLRGSRSGGKVLGRDGMFEGWSLCKNERYNFFFFLFTLWGIMAFLFFPDQGLLRKLGGGSERDNVVFVNDDND